MSAEQFVFRVGDRVESPVHAIGVVESVGNGVVVVRYRERGQSWTTKYDAEWFAKWPTMLQPVGRGR